MRTQKLGYVPKKSLKAPSLVSKHASNGKSKRKKKRGKK